MGDGTCWIQGRHNIYRLLFYIPLFLYLISALLLFVYIIRFRTILQNPNHLVTRMIAFVATFVVLWLWISIIFIWEFATDSDAPDFLLAMHCITLAGQGFGNFCVWSSSPALRGFCCRRCYQHESWEIVPINPKSKSDSESMMSVLIQDQLFYGYAK